MFNFKFSLCLLSTVVEVQGRYLQIKKEILIFKVPVIFKNENFAMHALGGSIFCRFFEIELPI